jgi:hypothetical protein
VETGNWKLETRRSKLVCREPRTEIRSLGFLERVVCSFQFPICNFQFPKRVGKLALALVATFATLANTTALRAQSCAMCYNTAAAAKAAAIQALRSGILILLVPVALMFIGIFILAFRSKERFCEPSPEEIDSGQGTSIGFVDCSDVIEVELCGLPSPSAPLPQRGEGRVSLGVTPLAPLGGEGGPQGPGEGVMRGR